MFGLFAQAPECDHDKETIQQRFNRLQAEVHLLVRELEDAKVCPYNYTLYQYSRPSLIQISLIRTLANLNDSRLPVSQLQTMFRIPRPSLSV